MKAQRKLTDLMRRMTSGFRKAFTFEPQPSRVEQEKRMEETRCWNMACVKYMIADLDPDECRRRTNAELGLPADYIPGRFSCFP